MTPIAFYAPLKSPDHPVPSGDRAMGRLLLAALARAGFDAELASELRTLDLDGRPARQADIRVAGEDEADRVTDGYLARPPLLRPRLWFTYHCYYKAPDWIGPVVSERLGIPYVIAEGSRSARRAHGPWALGHAGAEAALARADCHVVMTPYDAEDLRGIGSREQRLVMLPPFLDASHWAEACAERRQGSTPPLRLLAVAMMRPGDKLASYRLLAEALASLPDPSAWTLDIVGDGPARAEVERLFAPIRQQARFHGAAADLERVARAYREADLLVWPAVGEAYGMALLEAQACGCPVLAGAEPGVTAAVRAGETAILVAPRDAAALAAALEALLADPSPLRAMSEAARRFIRGQRDLPHAAAILGAALRPLLADRPEPRLSAARS